MSPGCFLFRFGYESTVCGILLFVSNSIGDKTNTTEWKDPVRTNRLLRQKYAQYIVPAVITYAALSLNEFVDSMLVSNLLGSEAMAIVSLGSPIVFVCSALYSLLGNGGSNVYALSLGRRDHNAAGKSLTASAVTALAAGLLILIVGLLFCDSLADILCTSEALRPEFGSYLYVLMLSAPLVILILTVTMFLPAAGHPGASTAVNVIANVLNIIMDYVYIRIFHMGVEGAAWATLTGYICGAIFMAVLILSKRVKLYYSRDIKGSLPSLKDITTYGRPDFINQIGLSLQYAVCNRLAIAYAGANGVVAYSLCLQAGSVLSIFACAVIGTSVTLLAVLHGQQDYKGESQVLSTALLNQVVISAIGLVLAMLFAAKIAGFYNIVEAEQLALSVEAFRIYALLFIPRYVVVIYYNYLKVIGFKRYPSIISALDSFALIIPCAWILTKIFGIVGLWWTFPIVPIILIIAMLIVNKKCADASGGKLIWPLLFEREVDGDIVPILDVTISRDTKDFAYVSMKVQEMCEEHGFSKTDAIKAGLAVEELAVYVANRKSQGTYADVLVRLIHGDVEIDYRCIGEFFDPTADEKGDIAENVKILRSIASSIENEYVMGMNSTRIIIEDRSKQEARESDQINSDD